MTQDEALTILKTGTNVFLTGEPGSGKTYTVNRFSEYLRERGVEPAITASTGIAATHIGGFTIHSWSGIGVRQKLNKYDIDHIANNKRVYGRVNNARVLVIDEVSMLSARTLEMVDAVCREVRQNCQPFGGLQVIFVGDFFQLPPVSSSHHFRESGNPDGDIPTLNLDSNILSSPPFQGGDRRGGSTDFAFASPVWEEANPLACYLSEQHRQEDAAFLEFLSAVRRGAVEERHKALLRTRYAKSPQSNAITQLYSHNADVDYINNQELAKLPGQPKAFVMEDRGPEPLVQALKRGCLSPETLSLKVGARVMFTKNDVEWKFVNGTTGVVTSFSKENGAPIVKTARSGEVRAEPVEWSLQDQGRVLAKIIQTPLRLAWAITVHKSQGMSLDTAHMNLADAFEYGQGYVALSRVRTLQGLSLAGLNTRALEVHPKVFAHDRHFRAASEAAQQKFRTIPVVELTTMQDNFIHAIGGKRPTKKGSPHPSREGVRAGVQHGRYARDNGFDAERRWTKTLSLISGGKTVLEVARARGRTIQTIFGHLEELLVLGKLDMEHIAHLKPDNGRLSKIQEAVDAMRAETSKAETATLYDFSGRFKFAPLRERLGESYSFDELRLARLFLRL